MSHERYYPEERMKVPFAGSLRPLDTPSGVSRVYEATPTFRPKETVILEEGEVSVDEATQIRERGGEFPMEVTIPEKIFPYITGESYKGK